LAGIGQPILFVLGQRVLYPDWLERLRYFPALLLIAIGLAASNSRAMIQAIFSRNHTFVRTPKGQEKIEDSSINLRYYLPFDWIILLEFLFAIYAGIGLFMAIIQDNYGPVLFMATCMVGFSYVALLSLFDVDWQNKSLRSILYPRELIGK
jgi:hypothetical protein